MNIKQSVKDAIAALFPKIGGGTDVLVKELLVANALATLADSRKKAAKKAVLDGGIVASEYRPGDMEVYRSEAFVVVAKTKEPSSRLDQALLAAALKASGVSQNKINAAIAAATVANKPATSFEVTER